jgi:ligand-binding sensor domain-containing protein/signal transduction histidine kinase
LIGMAALLVWSSWALAQSAGQVRFRVLDEPRGLPQSSVSAIVQDSRGYVWLGTQDGLARFDGHEFRVMRRDALDPASLADSYVQALAISADDVLWIGSPSRGLSRLDLRSLELQRYSGDRGRELGLAEDAVTGLHIDRQGQLWVSLRGGVQAFDPQSGRFEPAPFRIPYQRRLRVLGDSPNHGLLIVADDALWRWRGGGQAAERIYQLPADSTASILAVADAGVELLWVALRGDGLVALDAHGQVRRHLRQDNAGLIDNEVMRLMLDSRGQLWIGHFGGLCRLGPEAARAECWKHQPGQIDGLPGSQITALMEDRDRRIWVGSWTGGAGVHAPEDERVARIGAAASGAGLPSRSVVSIAEATDGSFWLALIDGGGLVRYDLERGLLGKHSYTDPALAQALALVLLADGETLWVGTDNSGLIRLGPEGQERHYPQRSDAPELGPAGRSIQSMHKDRQDRLWIGTASDGLSMLCPDCDEFRHFQASEDAAALASNSVNAILQTRDGRIWLALRRGGVNLLDPLTGRVQRYTLPSPEGDIVFSATALLEDRAGRLWVGTQGFGLQLLERDGKGDFTGFRAITTRDGLPANAIGAILEDPAGFLWVSTTAGLARVQPERARAEAWRPFSLGRGEDYYVGSALQASSGQFLFGGVSGLTSFRPEHVVLSLRPPRVQLSAAYIDHLPYASARRSGPAEVAFADSLSLHYPQVLLNLELSSQPLLSTAPVRYSYRLDPLDEDWSELPGQRRELGFSRLAAGDYRLRLRARFEGYEDWGEESQIGLSVYPPPWRSTQAWLAYLVLGLGTLGLLAWLLRRNWIERTRAAAALAASATLLRESLWGSRGELWDCDLQTGQIRRENHLPHLKVDQVAAEQSLRGLRPFVHEADRQSFDEGLRACLNGETDYLQISYRTLDDRDHWRWMLTRGKLLERDAEGCPRRLVGTTFDITDVRAQEDALRESQARLRLALWGSGDELWDLDVRANRVHRENPLQQVTLPQDLKFRDSLEYLDFAHPDDRPAFRDALRDHIAGRNEFFEGSFRLPGRDGCWVWVLARGRAVARDDQGRALRVVGTNRDISRLKAVEAELKRLNEDLEEHVRERTATLESTVAELRNTLEQLKQAQAQLIDAEKMAALGNLVAGVAHDINTPVGIGVTAATHLRDELQRLKNHLLDGRLRRSQLEHFVQVAEQSTVLIHDNLERASGLVRSFKQVAVDQASEQRRQIDLARYLEEILLSLKPSLKHGKVAVRIDCADGIMLETYPGALYQIVANLVLNAINHAYPNAAGGVVEIRARVAGGVLQLSVSDDGCGMEEGIRARVFEPFFTTRRDEGGSGLGLHIVYNLSTELLGGSVRCESRPGEGSTFILQLPLRPPAASTASASAGGDAP